MVMKKESKFAWIYRRNKVELYELPLRGSLVPLAFVVVDMTRSSLSFLFSLLSEPTWWRHLSHERYP